MSIATGELADWPKAPGVPADRTDARVPHFAVAPSSWSPFFPAAAGNGEGRRGGISGAAPGR